MSSGSLIKTRSKRVASLVLPPGTLLRTLGYLRRPDVLLRLALCLLAAIVMWGATRGWAPPFSYRTGYIPPRDVVALADFQLEDPEATKEAREKARREVVCFYEHDALPLRELRQALKDTVFQVLRAESLDDLDAAVRNKFFPATEEAQPSDSPNAETNHFETFRTALEDDPELEEFDQAVEAAFADFERNGLLESLGHPPDDGLQSEIQVHPIGNAEFSHRVPVEDVRLAEAEPRLKERLARELPSGVVAERVFSWLVKSLPTTLTYNSTDSRILRDKADKAVIPKTITYEKGTKIPYVNAGEPLYEDGLEMLELEHDTLVASLDRSTMFVHTIADLGMYFAMYVLCGVYIFYREPRLLSDLRRFATMLALFVFVIIFCTHLSRAEWFGTKIEWRAELVPLVMFGIIITIAYRQELALLLVAVASLVVVLSLGQGLDRFVVYVATSAAAIELSGHIRSRSKLIYVGICAAVVGLLTTAGVGLLTGHPLGAVLLWDAVWYAFCAVLATLLMTGLLPFMEALFDVQTELSLLELGDAAHPLLQELVQRAPGTYNHSINVASIAEAAAESIGANGLLLRVGAYFHDIGKILKPGYFVENQGQEDNRHESLVPAMSTLVIIAHVKDGADLARQHRLPQSIIDFIEQHHGTTLVEYFYDQARGQSQQHPENGDVDESTFRYPGPKPQTKEAGVMMLADSVESACRTLVEPTPARIESLVKEIAMKRLLDGEFDESGLTLSELRTIEESLVKSLTAVYHGRVKYPGRPLTA